MNDSTNLPVSPAPNRYGPVTAGEMLECTAALLRENFKLFFGIVLVFIGAEIVFFAILGGSGFWVGHSIVGTAPLARVLVIVPTMFVGGIIVFIIGVIVQGALFIATDTRIVGAQISIGEACRRAAEKTGRLVGIGLLIVLRTIGYFFLFGVAVLVIFLAITLAAHVGNLFRPNIYHASMLGIGIGILAVLVLIALYAIFYFWLFGRYALAVPATMAEDLSVTDSIRRSVRLSSHSRGRLYALLVAVICIELGMIAVTVPFQLMGMHSTMLHPVTPGGAFTVLTILLQIFQVVVGGIVFAIMGVATAVCYYDLRVRKEGFGASPAPPPEAPVVSFVPPSSDLPAEDFPMA